jgi:hypothetical protein
VRGTYIGAPLIFQFDKVETVRGCKVAGSVLQRRPQCILSCG